MGVLVQSVGLLAAFIHCAIRAPIDFRARRYGWSAATTALAALLVWGLFVPVPTHAVKITVPIKS